MQTQNTRPNVTNIIAACIIAAGMIGSARILSQRPTTSSSADFQPTVSSVRIVKAVTNSPLSVASSVALPVVSPPVVSPPVVSPPLSQESVKTQVLEQIHREPKLRAVSFNGGAYKLSDATISQVSYESSNDSFLVVVKWVWQPAMSSDGLQASYLTLRNNGYNQYVGAVNIGSTYSTGTEHIVYFTVK